MRNKLAFLYLSFNKGNKRLSKILTPFVNPSPDVNVNFRKTRNLFFLLT